MNALELIAGKPLDLESELPLYQQLEERILQAIAAEALEPDQPLPTEIALCEALGLSRATVRRCFEDLVERGCIVRRRGKGTFISRRPTPHGGPYLNFSDRMAAAGLYPSSQTISFERMDPPTFVKRRLRLGDNEQIFRIKRLRLADERPMTIDTVHIPCRICPALTEQDLKQSLYRIIAESTGTMPARADETLEAVSLTRQEAELLDADPGLASFLITRTTFDGSGMPFEVTRTVAPGDRNRYDFSTSGLR